MNSLFNRNPGAGGVFARLRGNHAGNTLAMMAIGMIPLAGLVGGAVDMSRIYLTKTRLQQACDAGVLAGRKVMGGGTWSASSNAANTAALQFFDGNFKSGAYGTTDRTRAYTESAGKVSGIASAKVPMTLMKIFKAGAETITVNCDAEMRLPNTDVMFVLDSTGSMNETLSGDNKTKMAGLRIAVKCFYEIVARLDTNVTCEGGAPSGGTGDQVQVRFGFVPYDMNVNVGRLLPSSYFADTWQYQSRKGTIVYGTFSSFYGTSGQNASTWSVYQNVGNSATGSNSSNCYAALGATPGDTFTRTGPPSWPVRGTETDAEWRAYAPYIQRNHTRIYNSSTKLCYIQQRERTIERPSIYQRSTSGAPDAIPFKAWIYRKSSIDVSGLKSGSGWNSSLTVPIGEGHTDKSITWGGCIEERETVRQTSYSPIPADAYDLDIDTLPVAGNQATLWGPALPDIVYARKTGYTNTGSYTLDDRLTFNQEYYDSNGNYQQPYSAEGYSCQLEARRLAEWKDASAFDSYVDSLYGGGNTYHDIGLLWGARLMSPTGLFRADNEFTPKGGEIERHLIFMTDGDACTAVMNYQAYGLSWYDRRQTDASVVPTDGCTTSGTLTQQVNARTAALCGAVKNKNITLWVIWFGEKNTYIENSMKVCASPNRFFSARNSVQLQQTFRSIADQISQLRLTK